MCHVIGEACIGITFVRNAFGVVGAMCLTPWVDRMGLYNMFVCSCCLSVGVVPMMVWGRQCRQWTAPRYTKMAGRQPEMLINMFCLIFS